MMPLESYYVRVWKRFCKDAIPWARDNIIWAVIVLVVPPLADAYLHKRSPQLDWFLLKFYILAALLYMFVNVCRVPRKLDAERETREAQLNTAFRDQEKTIQELKNTGPRPVVVAKAYETRLGSVTGLVTVNNGTAVAYDISVPKVVISPSIWLESNKRYTQLLNNGTDDAFFAIFIQEDGEGGYSGDMLSARILLYDTSLVVPITYHGGDNQWWQTDVTLEHDVLCPKGVGIRNSLPPKRIAPPS